MAPKNAYFEFDAQPARITPYTPAEVSASTYSRPASMFAMTNVSFIGTTAHTASAGTSESTGASRNRNLFAFVGSTISFRSILMTSANGWSKPFQPTRFGPMRTCIQARILRSQYVKYATLKISGTSTTTILTTLTIRS